MGYSPNTLLFRGGNALTPSPLYTPAPLLLCPCDRLISAPLDFVHCFTTVQHPFYNWCVLSMAEGVRPEDYCDEPAEDEFGEIIKCRSDEREDVQKKTFTKWVNSQLAKTGKPPVEDLFSDLCDGRRLLELLEGLTGHELVKLERGFTRVHSLNNVNRALQILQKNNVELVNIGAADIVDGNHKLILGLIWSIILHWQVKDVMKDVMEGLQQTNSEKILLSWVRQNTRQYPQVCSFSQS
ncbi:utrophin [Oreochromis niloticus]|uniref:utrophin n=1 Tax=Oreochromis niloticus TaxID=8128 RepID=UPI000DF38C4F|nr:utrophin [Oreochromis niloticus]